MNKRYEKALPVIVRSWAGLMCFLIDGLSLDGCCGYAVFCGQCFCFLVFYQNSRDDEYGDERDTENDTDGAEDDELLCENAPDGCDQGDCQKLCAICHCHIQNLMDGERGDGDQKHTCEDGCDTAENKRIAEAPCEKRHQKIIENEDAEDRQNEEGISEDIEDFSRLVEHGYGFLVKREGK